MWTGLLFIHTSYEKSDGSQDARSGSPDASMYFHLGCNMYLKKMRGIKSYLESLFSQQYKSQSTKLIMFSTQYTTQNVKHTRESILSQCESHSYNSSLSEYKSLSFHIHINIDPNRNQIIPNLLRTKLLIASKHISRHALAIMKKRTKMHVIV